MTQRNAHRCSCGRVPSVIKESDGYWYVCCEAACSSESTWDKDRAIAIDNWNRKQGESDCGPHRH